MKVAMPTVDLLIGPANSGKTTYLLNEYAGKIASEGPESAVLILPTHRRVSEIKYRLLTDFGLPGLLDARITTFPDLADRLLTENVQTIRRISVPAQHLLLRRIVDEMSREGALNYFAPVQDFPGFLSALLELITELKRGAVEPEDFLRLVDSAEFSDPRTQELATLYFRYQQRLNDLNLFDSEGRFWWARNLLEEGKPRPFQNLRSVYVDGFSDWTPTQWDVLRRLVEASESAFFTLTMENRENSLRPDLFAPVERTRRRFEETFKQVSVEFLECQPVPGDLLGHVAKWLFVPLRLPESQTPEQQPPGPSPIQRICAPGRSREVESIARQVKSLLLDGVRPVEIGVLFRDLAEYGPLAQEVFAEFGIPAYVGRGASLIDQPLVKTLFALLDIPLHDYRREDVLRFFGSNYVSLSNFSGDDLTIGELDRTTREAVITRGKDRWSPKLESLRLRSQRAAGKDTDEAGPAPVPPGTELVGAVEKTMAFFRALCSTLELLPREGTLSEYLQALPTLCTRFGIGPARLEVSEACLDATGVDESGARSLDVFPDAQLSNRESLCWAALRTEIDSWLRLATQFEDFNPTLELRQFVSTFRDLLSRVNLSPESWTEDKVAVLDVYETRELSFDHLFLGGMAEKEFPRRVRESAFFSDQERSRLNACGINLEERLPMQHEEAYLFYLTLTRARQRVYLSYPATDADGGEVLASHYVQEVVRCLGGESFLPVVKERLSEVTHPLREVCHLGELTERVFHDFRTLPGQRQVEPDGEPEALAAYNYLSRYHRSRMEHFGRCVSVQERRYGRVQHDVFDGMLREEADVVADLHRRFPPDKAFSSSQLGLYGSCPFRYFTERLLHLEPLKDPSEFLQAVDRGRVYHRVVQRFFEGLKAVTGSSRVTAETRSAAERLLNRIIEDVFTREEDLVHTPDRAHWLIEKSVCRDVMRLFLKLEESLAKEQEPAWFEQTYDESCPLRVTVEQDTVCLVGRIDRVDLLGDQGFVVYDYKTGRTGTTRDLRDGADLQLPIYAMAARELLFGGAERSCVRWAYYKLARPVGFGGKATVEEIPDLIDVARKHVVNHVNHLRGGYFPVLPKPSACLSCDLKPLCRVEHWRIRDKTEPPVPTAATGTRQPSEEDRL
ncbi:MAG: exodeoxyribonuclease V subunit gamma [Armatimonadetes bacterium]|nr:exodeoxyribonuclease V subunit gamma [Armatimonadota bacterium]